MGLKANPSDTLMLNNYAFCVASLGDYASAESALARVPAEVVDADGVLLATKGLIEFRKGGIDVGRAFYNRAIDTFERAQLPKSVAIAAIFLAREELAADTEAALAAVEKASKVASGRSEPEILRWLTVLKRASGLTRSRRVL